jgi:hypothetical protein
MPPRYKARISRISRVSATAPRSTLRGGMPYAGGRAIITEYGRIYSTDIAADTANGIGG